MEFKIAKKACLLKVLTEGLLLMKEKGKANFANTFKKLATVQDILKVLFPPFFSIVI